MYFKHKQIFLLLHIFFVINWNCKTVHGQWGTISDIDDLNFELLIAGGLLPTSAANAKRVVSIRTARHISYWGDNHLCAGAVLSKKIILTSANCVTNQYEVIIRTGRIRVVAGYTLRLARPYLGVVYKIDEIVPHPGYAYDKLHDIALLKLKYYLPYYLHSTDMLAFAKRRPPNGTMCTTYGWGQLYQDGPYADEIVYADLYIIEDQHCYNYYDQYSADNYLCLAADKYDIDVCAGDMGSPLICNNTIQGVVPGVVPCLVTTKHPIKFLNAIYYIDWIRKHINKSNHMECQHIFFYTFIIAIIISTN